MPRSTRVYSPSLLATLRAWNGNSTYRWYHVESGCDQGVCPIDDHILDSQILLADLSYLLINFVSLSAVSFPYFGNDCSFWTSPAGSFLTVTKIAQALYLWQLLLQPGIWRQIESISLNLYLMALASPDWIWALHTIVR